LPAEIVHRSEIEIRFRAKPASSPMRPGWHRLAAKPEV